MTYTRKFLSKIRHTPEGQPVIQELVQKLLRSEELTLAEEEVACSIAKILRDETGKYKFDIAKIKGCENFRFKSTYLIYANDLEGKGIVRDYLGVIDSDRKMVDVAFLDDEFSSWKKVVIGKKGSDILLNYLIDETLHQIKIMEKFFSVGSVSAQNKTYLEKSIVLHSRFIFLLVKEFCQDFGSTEVIVDFHGNKVLIDQFCFVHTMFRHFAASVKDYQIGKSYHFDQSVPYRELPLFLERFVKMFMLNCPKSNFDGRSINLVFKGKRYALWFRPFTKPGTAVRYLRLQTFYPIDLLKDKMRVQGLKKVKINSRINFLVIHSF